jgi:hypothetical protein
LAVLTLLKEALPSEYMEFLGMADKTTPSLFPYILLSCSSLLGKSSEVSLLQEAFPEPSFRLTKLHSPVFSRKPMSLIPYFNHRFNQLALFNSFYPQCLVLHLATTHTS